MNPSNFSIELDPRLDRNDQIYFLGKKKFPGYLDLSKGLTLLAFVAVDGAEEIQIAINDKESSSFSKVKQEQMDANKIRLKIPVESRQDQNGLTFYVCKINTNLVINCFDEVTFFLYTSKKGKEQIQIVGHMLQVEDVPREINRINSNIEIHHVRRRD